MLSVLKQKIMASEESRSRGLQKNSDALMVESEKTETLRRIPSTSGTSIVSHVPVSIQSKGLKSGSSESTISSMSSASSDDILTGRKKSASHGFRTTKQDSHDESQTKQPAARQRTVSIEDDLCRYEPSPKKLKISKEKSYFSLSSSAEQSNASAGVALLASEADDSAVNPLHAFVRKQIEVFTATPEELKQPAPGRKQPIQLHQVGLRCIHCKDKPKATRVKRAVCYPSNLCRIYHAVSDMKFDHFNHCKNLPPLERSTFDRLKLEQDSIEDKKKKNGRMSSTSKYYLESATNMGMVDGIGGIFMFPYGGSTSGITPLLPKPPVLEVTTGEVIDASGLPRKKRPVPIAPAARSSPTISLHEDTDINHLNGIHCFVRKHTEFFSATEADLSAPAPGRRTKVVLGQVGIRCIHCRSLPIEQRVKRAVCYPPQINGIYHAVSNMKFDHFAACRGLPLMARKEFGLLKESFCRKGSGGNATGAASSTRKYYLCSALRKGLVDTDAGIRFGSTEHTTTTSIHGVSELPNGMSVLVEAINRSR